MFLGHFWALSYSYLVRLTATVTEHFFLVGKLRATDKRETVRLGKLLIRADDKFTHIHDMSARMNRWPSNLRTTPLPPRPEQAKTNSAKEREP